MLIVLNEKVAIIDVDSDPSAENVLASTESDRLRVYMPLIFSLPE